MPLADPGLAWRRARQEVRGAQAIITLVTFAAPIVPVPDATVHFSETGVTGSATTVTSYVAPLGKGVVKANEPLAERNWLVVPLFSTASESFGDRPTTLPPTV